ncbi:hypothetical protein [uncultured Legionella sp.]|uniref:hypothetical protein n=1 Tax=uncultured Legionella sp. TaxID=210934 RepID=UPI00260B1106|nr:hypothetical protein [uncultured Legionella sp.]
MPDDAKKPQTLSLNTDHSTQEGDDSTNELTKGSQDTQQSQESSEAMSLDNTEQKTKNNASGVHQPVFFSGPKRKQMVPLLKTEAEEETTEYKPRTKHTELCDDPLCDCGEQHDINSKQSINLQKPSVLSRFSFNSAPKLDYEKNLSPDFYQPFLQELFTLIAKNSFDKLFILTGSAAKQLQNSTERNPNDIDLLLKNADLVEGTAKLKKMLVQMSGVSVAHDDCAGTLSIQYKGTLFKVQVIDSQTSKHCFPAKKDENKHQQVGAIVMLDAAVIPQKEFSDVEDDLGSDIEIECINFKF